VPQAVVPSIGCELAPGDYRAQLGFRLFVLAALPQSHGIVLAQIEGLIGVWPALSRGARRQTRESFRGKFWIAIHSPLYDAPEHAACHSAALPRLPLVWPDIAISPHSGD
jgi:hypothetical protein